ncbi:amino acid permease [Leifsonia aquatica]|uniref:L-asparagine permease n=2 Tax=Leifsonia aquatica TaxID=144185 RepID=A0A7W4UZ39_LEIAQ|nr:amino acid permease [Leifsonia aquatica]MBB2968373.1 L-asparagine permease [Leifsonia aquatica]
MRRSTPPDRPGTAGSGGYHRELKPRHIQMIAIGGAIGTGLFLGAGGRLASAGPSLVIAYAVCGLAAFLILRALGELVLRRPDSGSFVSYAREFLGEKAGFVTGWMYWMYWAMIGVVDATAVAVYLRFFGAYLPFFAEVPQWVWALCALLLVFGLNLLSVKVFGELEFWFALIKVAALVLFLIIGTLFVVLGTPVAGHTPGFSLLAESGGMFPHGVVPLILVVQGVVFAYGAIELVGTAAGETADPERTMPRAINSVILRIALFYVGSVLLLALLLPSSAYSADESPFVTFFASIGVQGADVVMNLVVLTAALSSLNAGFYSTGRIARSLALRGAAPAFAARMNRSGVPYGGIVITGTVALLGIVLNVLLPEQAFEIGINLTSVGLLTAWSVIVLCQLTLYRRSRRGEEARPSFRMPWSPWSGYVALAFLATVGVLILLDYPTGTFTVGAAVVIVIPLLIGGWYLMRRRVTAFAEREDTPAASSPARPARAAPRP